MDVTTRIQFTRDDTSRINSNFMIGFIEAKLENNNPQTRYLFELLPPTLNIDNIFPTLQYQWDMHHRNGRNPRWFPVLGNGVVDTGVVIGMCNTQREVPQGAEVMLRVNDYNGNSYVVFVEKNERNYYKNPPIYNLCGYLLGNSDGTWRKHIDNFGDILNNEGNFDVNRLYGNVTSSDEINYDTYFKP